MKMKIYAILFMLFYSGIYGDSLTPKYQYNSGVSSGSPSIGGGGGYGSKPTGGWCGSNRCQKFESCVNWNGIKMCAIYPGDSPGTSTGEVNGPVHCGGVYCYPGQYCAEVNHKLQCLKKPSTGQGQGGQCGYDVCLAGQACGIENGVARCVWERDYNNKCGKAICQLGQSCKHINGHERCVTYPPVGQNCGATRCPEDTNCILENGLLKCVNSTSPFNCGLFNCREFEYCVNANGILQCIPGDDSYPTVCDKEVCVVGQICVQVDGCGQCINIPPPPKNCGRYNCTGNDVCLEVDGYLQCVTPPGPPETCDLTCEADEVCIFVDSWPQCVEKPLVAIAQTSSSASITGITSGGLTRCGLNFCTSAQRCTAVGSVLQCI